MGITFHYRSQALPQNQQIDGVQDMFPFVPIFDSHPVSPFSSHISPNPPYRFALPPLLFLSSRVCIRLSV